MPGDRTLARDVVWREENRMDTCRKREAIDFAQFKVKRLLGVTREWTRKSRSCFIPIGSVYFFFAPSLIIRSIEVQPEETVAVDLCYQKKQLKKPEQ